MADEPTDHPAIRGLKALSVRQPWVWGIFHAGKDVENRSWGDRYPALHSARSLLGKDILIHASTGMTLSEYEDFIDTAHMISRTHPFPPGTRLPPRLSLTKGGIVGIVTLHAIVTESESPWFFGPVGLVLRNPRTLPFMPCRGALGFFKPEIANAG